MCQACILSTIRSKKPGRIRRIVFEAGVHPCGWWTRASLRYQSYFTQTEGAQRGAERKQHLLTLGGFASQRRVLSFELSVLYCIGLHWLPHSTISFSMLFTAFKEAVFSCLTAALIRVSLPWRLIERGAQRLEKKNICISCLEVCLFQ